MGRLVLGLAIAMVGCVTNSIELETDADVNPGDGSSGGAGTTSMTMTMTMTTDATMTSPTTDQPTTAVPDTGLDDAGPAEVSFFADVAPILQQTCAPGCHEPGGVFEEQDLLNSPYFALVEVLSTQSIQMFKVAPGRPEVSYLLHKISGTHLENAGAGGVMPLGMAPLSQAQIDIIEQWILAGAPNN